VPDGPPHVLGIVAKLGQHQRPLRGPHYHARRLPRIGPGNELPASHARLRDAANQAQQISHSLLRLVLENGVGVVRLHGGVQDGAATLNAVLLGKTTTPEYGWKGVTDSPLTGFTGNPWAPGYTAGGSSGGAAAAVAFGMGQLAVGTDGGGSVRIPASFCGIVALKPTYGRIPLWPASPFGTLSHAGPMTRTVADAALMLDVLAGPEVRDRTALPPADIDYQDVIEGGVEGLRVAFSPDLGYVDLDPEVREAVGAAARAFQEMGAEVEETDPGFEDPIECFDTHWYAGAANALRDYDERARELMDPGLIEIVGEGAGYSVMRYLQAVSRRSELGIHMGRFHTNYDLLLTPTMSIPAFEGDGEVPEGWPHRRWTSWTPYTYPFNLTQQPAASVPCGFTRSGLPIGLQIIGARFADALVLRAAHAYQIARPLADRRPPGAEDDAT
jgi:aspartyl-tRNA(Asn)/glutamyl-tRNA(Gln) amidotransferase subunit A